ncbi:MAG: DUF3014 domain-containing protein [Thiohalobacteraceae bacterium]
MSDRKRRKNAGRRKAVLGAIVVLAVVGIAAALYMRMAEDEQIGIQETSPADQPTETGPTAPRYPLPEADAPPATSEEDPALTPGQPLLPADEEQAAPPALNASDEPVGDVLADLADPEPLQRLFRLDEVVRRFVVTIENLPAKKLPRRDLLVARRVPGQFLIAGEGEETYISPDNAERYRPYVGLVTRIEPERVAAAYTRFYPLFQEAYAELGYPNAYFNDRLVDVIDHLLATPVVDEPIRLVRPHVFYLYADPELEALSAGQKALIRMGNANAEQVRQWLRRLRAELTRAARPAAD